MKKILGVVVVVLLAVCVVAVVTCPDRQKHHDVLEETMNEVMNELVSDADDDSVFGLGLATIGTTLASKLIANVMETTLQVHDYILFSTGEVTVAGKKKIVSVGAFGHVFPTFDSDDIKKAVDGTSYENENGDEE